MKARLEELISVKKIERKESAEAEHFHTNHCNEKIQTLKERTSKTQKKDLIKEATEMVKQLKNGSVVVIS